MPMGRINYKGFDLPDGAAIPDVPADLQRLVDSMVVELSPKVWRKAAVHDVASDAAVTATLKTIAFNDARGGLLIVQVDACPLAWNVVSSGSFNVWLEYLDSAGAVNQSTQSVNTQQSFGLGVAPAAYVDQGAITHMAMFVMPVTAGNVSVRARGVMNSKAGWATGVKADWSSNLSVALYPHTLTVGTG